MRLTQLRTVHAAATLPASCKELFDKVAQISEGANKVWNMVQYLHFPSYISVCMR